MKNFKNIFALLVIALMGLSLTGCSNDDLDTNQYQGGIALNVYGPQPVMRGGTLRFLGSNLDQITQVIIPGVDPITNIEVVKAGVPSEIRVVIPHDGPEPGYITLVANNDTRITTKTELTYIEGISIEGFTPASAMPGEVITITGDYLNLVHMVEFADEVRVGEENFIEHDRYTIKVAVPEEARTGKLNLYTADLTVETEADTDVSYNIITTEEALEVGLPTIVKLASPRGEADPQGTIVAKQGETITITGRNLQLIDGLSFGDADSELGVKTFDTFTVNEDGTTITFALDPTAPDGSINLICRSGVEVPTGVLQTVAPTQCAIEPNPAKNGQLLTISGQDMDVVKSVEFFDIDDQTLDGGDITVDAGKVVVAAVPETAVDGKLILRMANGKGVEVALALVKPVITAYNANPISAGAVLTITGTDLDLVKSIQFGDGDVAEVEPSADGTSLNVTVPMNATSGAPVLTLINGTTIEDTPQITIEEAVFCYATALPDADAQLKAGESLTLTVANSDKLTGVEIDGVACGYVLVKNGTELIIAVPEKAKNGSKVRLISSNGEITYTIDFIPNTEVTTVLWTGAVDLGSWSVNWQIGDGSNGASNPTMFTDMDLQVGDVIRIYATAYNDWWQIQFFDGHWGGQTEIGNATGLDNGNNINAGIYDLNEHNGCIEIPVTEALLEQLTTLNDWGYCWIIQGESLVITKIDVTHYVVLEETLWSGDVDFNSWGINWQIGDGYGGADNPNMFVDAGLKVGQTIRLYITAYDDWWQVQFFDGHWGGQTEIGNATGLDNGNNINAGIYNLAEHNGCIEIPVTATLQEQLTTLNDWGYCWILQGEGCRATKITVE